MSLPLRPPAHAVLSLALVAGLTLAGCPVHEAHPLPAPPPGEPAAAPAPAPASPEAPEGRPMPADAPRPRAGATALLKPAAIEEVQVSVQWAGEAYATRVSSCATEGRVAVLPSSSLAHDGARWVETGQSAFLPSGELRRPGDGERTLEVGVVNWRLEPTFAEQIAPKIGAAAGSIANAAREGSPVARLVIRDRSGQREIASCEAGDYDAATPADTIVTSARFALAPEAVEALRSAAAKDVHIEVTTRHPVELGQEGIVGSFHAVRDMDMRSALGLATTPDGRHATQVVGIGGKGEVNAEITRTLSRRIAIEFKRYDTRTDWPDQIFTALLSALQEQSAAWRADEERVTCFVFRDGVRLTGTLKDAKTTITALDRASTEEEKKKALEANAGLSWTAPSGGPGGSGSVKSTVEDRTKRDHLAELKRDAETNGLALTHLRLDERGRVASLDESRVRVAVSRVTGTATHMHRVRLPLSGAFAEREPVRVDLPVQGGQIAVGQHAVLATFQASPAPGRNALRAGMRVAVTIRAEGEPTFETSVGYLLAYQPGFEEKGRWDLRDQVALRDLRGRTSVNAGPLLVKVPESGRLAIGIKVDACQSNAGGGNAPSGPLRITGGTVRIEEVRD